MKSAYSNSDSTKLEVIAWELDGGNYTILDRAVLVGGRLYENEDEIVRAVLRLRTRKIAHVIATAITPGLILVAWLATSGL